MERKIRNTLILIINSGNSKISYDSQVSNGDKNFLFSDIECIDLEEGYSKFLESNFSYLIILNLRRWKNKLVNISSYLVNCVESLENTEHYAICQPSIIYGNLLEEHKLIVSQKKMHTYIYSIDESFVAIKGSVARNFRINAFILNQKINWDEYHKDINSYGFESYRLCNCYIEVEPYDKSEIIKHESQDSIDLLNKSYLKKNFDIGIEFSYLAPIYNGTSEYATNILGSLVEIFQKNKISFQIIADLPIIKKFELEKYSHFLIDSKKCEENFYKLLFIPQQVYSVLALEKINRICFQYVFTMLDVIALRCRYLGEPRGLDIASSIAYKYCASVLGLSKSSSDDIEAFFSERLIFKPVIPILLTKSMDLRNKDNLSNKFSSEKEFVLLMGNAFKHKAIEKTLDALYDSDIKVIVVGIESGIDKFKKRFKFYPSGQLSNQMIESLYQNSSLILYPSLYEGFGLPVVAALQIGKRILVYDSLINRELKLEFDRSGLISFFDSFSDLTLIIKKILNSPVEIKKEFIVTRTWEHVSEETAAILLSNLKTILEFDVINQRIYDIREVRKIIENSPLVKLHRLRSLAKLVFEITLRILNGYRARAVGVLLKILGRKK